MERLTMIIVCTLVSIIFLVLLLVPLAFLAWKTHKRNKSSRIHLERSSRRAKGLGRNQSIRPGSTRRTNAQFVFTVPEGIRSPAAIDRNSFLYKTKRYDCAERNGAIRTTEIDQNQSPPGERIRTREVDSQSAVAFGRLTNVPLVIETPMTSANDHYDVQSRFTIPKEELSHIIRYPQHQSNTNRQHTGIGFHNDRVIALTDIASETTETRDSDTSDEDLDCSGFPSRMANGPQRYPATIEPSYPIAGAPYGIQYYSRDNISNGNFTSSAASEFSPNYRPEPMRRNKTVLCVAANDIDAREPKVGRIPQGLYDSHRQVTDEITRYVTSKGVDNHLAGSESPSSSILALVDMPPNYEQAMLASTRQQQFNPTRYSTDRAMVTNQSGHYHNPVATNGSYFLPAGISFLEPSAPNYEHE